MLILIDILFMISPTVIERSRLQRQNEELNSDDDNVSQPYVARQCVLMNFLHIC